MSEETVVEKPVETVENSSSASEVKEDVVIIDGKPRPLKNFVSELQRKVKEDILKEIKPPADEPKPVQPSQPSQPVDYRKQITAMAEREMEETGSIVPVNTILSLINQGTTYGISEYAKRTKNAQQTIKKVRKDLRDKYKDFNDYAEEFDAIVEDIDPGQISKEGLGIIFDSLRGKNIDKILEKTKTVAEEPKIIGEPGKPSSMVSTGPKTTKLTDSQKQEMKSMGFDLEEDYLGRLETKRRIAKQKGAKNIPELLSDLLQF